MNLQQQTQNVAAQGRYGDSMLMHVNPAEVAGLSQVMPLTINPETGQPEAFLPFLLPLLGGLGGTALAGSAAGLGLSGAALGAIGSGLGTWAATGDIKKGILGGLTGYGIGKVLGAGMTAAKGAQAAATIPATTGTVGINAANMTADEIARNLGSQAGAAGAAGAGAGAGAGSGLKAGLSAAGKQLMQPSSYIPASVGLGGLGTIQSQENFVKQMAQLQLDDTEEYNRIIAEHPEYVPMLRGNTTYASDGGIMGYAAGGNTRAVAGVETRPIDPFFMAGFQPETAYLKNLNPSSGQIISGQSGYDYGTEIENRPMSGPFDPTQTTGYQNFYNAPAASYVLDPYQKFDLGPLPERREPINIMPIQAPIAAPQPNPNRIGPQPMPTPDFNPVAPVNAVTPSEDLTNPTASMYGSSPTNIGTGGAPAFTNPNSTVALGRNPINTISDTYYEYGNPLFSLGPADSALLGPSNAMFNPDALGTINSDISTALKNAAAVDEASSKGFFEKSMENKTKDAIVERLKSDLSDRVINTSSSGSYAPVKGSGAAGMANAKSKGQVAIPNVGAYDVGSAMNTLYGGAGSSFESGRNEYTESGQYDRDREARQAEFDAMRANGPKLTQEETQQAVKDMQERIGFGGVMSTQGGGSAYEAGLAARARAAADEERGFVDYGEPVFAAPQGGGGVFNLGSEVMNQIGSELPVNNFNAQVGMGMPNPPQIGSLNPPQRQTRPIGRGGRGGRAAGGTTDLPNKGLEALNKVAPNVVDRMGFQEGGMLTDQLSQTSIMNDPITQEVVLFILGESEDDESVNNFIEKYGSDAFMQLRDTVLQSMTSPDVQTEGLITGTGQGGMADNIPMDVSGTPAAVSQGEFIVPSDVVSMLGDGDTDSGGNELYAMMDRVRKTKTGTTKQAPELLNAGGLMPA